jgi:hypothetical protein
VALVAAVVAVGTVLLPATPARPRRGARGPAATAVPLAALQVGGYTLMEVAERLAAGAPLSSLFLHHLFLLGVLIQIGLAGVAALALWWLRGAAGRLAALAVPTPHVKRRALPVLPLPAFIVRSVARSVAPPSRAPPGARVGAPR